MVGQRAADSFTADAVQRALTTRRFGRSLHLLEEVDSTNGMASSLAQEGAPHGTVVVGRRQTAGRGRLGRQWLSPPEGLYLSLIVRPDAAPERLSWLPLMAAVAGAAAIEQLTRLEIGLKWPNDLLHSGRKLGGILCEAAAIAAGAPDASRHATAPAYVVIGIGINVNTPAEAFPPELREIATSLAIACHGPVDRLQLLVTLLGELERLWVILYGPRLLDLQQEYHRRCVTLGRSVSVQLPAAGQLEGVAVSIGPDGSLQVQRHGRQELVTIRAGDVLHVR